MQGVSELNTINHQQDCATDEHRYVDDAQRLLRVRNLLAWQFGVELHTIHADTGLIEDLYADSLGLLEMAQVLNDEFNIEITPEWLADMHLVADVDRAVAALLPAPPVSL